MAYRGDRKTKRAQREHDKMQPARTEPAVSADDVEATLSEALNDKL